MSVETDLIDKVKEINGLTSNYQVWKLTGVSQPDLSRYINEDKALNLSDAVKLTGAINENALKWMALSEAARNKDRKISQKLKELSAALSIGYTYFLVNFSEMTQPMYIMLN